MVDNQIKLLNFFKTNFLQLKEKAKTLNLVNEDITNDERGRLKRSVFKWELSEKILIFNQVEQIEFNDKPLVINLKTENSTFQEIEKIVKEFVGLIGKDANNKGNLAEIEPSILEDYHSRFWSFNKNHENLKSEYPPEGEGYMITIKRHKKKSELQIIGVINLFKNEASS